MIKYTIKKDFHGNIDIRENIVEKAIKENISIKVNCISLNKTKEYTVEELKNPIRKQGPYKSKFNNDKYHLYVYKI